MDTSYHGEQPELVISMVESFDWSTWVIAVLVVLAMRILFISLDGKISHRCLVYGSSDLDCSRIPDRWSRTRIFAQMPVHPDARQEITLER